MKLDIFSKRNMLDEMQEQKLCKLESRGFWILWWGLLAAILVQKLSGAPVSQIVGEWILFMIACLYGLVGCLRNGIWDRHIKPTLGANILGALIAAAIVFVFTLLQNNYWPGALFSSAFTFLLCLAVLELIAGFYRKRREQLEHPSEEDDE